MQAAKCSQSIADYLSAHQDMGITSQFVSSQASAAFGRSPRGSLVFFAPTDAAWKQAATRLSAPRFIRCRSNLRGRSTDLLQTFWL